jgi:PAS domain S-box-containing protein
VRSVSTPTDSDSPERFAARERVAMLADLSRALGAAADEAAALTAALDCLVPEFASSALIHLLDAGGAHRLAAARYRDADADAHEVLTAPAPGDGWWHEAVAEALRTEAPVIATGTSFDAAPAAPIPAPRSSMTLLLVAAGSTHGLLTVARDDAEPPFEHADLAFAEAVAAALALALRAAAIAAKQGRAAALAEATRALIDAGPHADAVLAVVARQAASHVGELAVVRLLSADGRWLEPAAVDHPDPAARGMAAAALAEERHSASAGANGDALRTARAQRMSGEALAHEQREEHPHLWPLLAEMPTGALLAAPLRAEGRAIGTLSVSRANAAPYDEEDERFVQELADRAGLAIERARLFAELGASEERLRLAQRAGNVGVWDWDATTDRTYWSETMWTLYGLEPGSATPGNAVWLPRLHPDDRARVEAAMTELLASAATEYHDEFRIVRPDGEERWLEVVARVTRDAAGRPLRMSGVNLDVTERKATEQALRASEERLRLAIEANRMVAWEWDPVADRIATSDNFAEIYGLPALAGAAEGMALVWPEDLPAHQEKVSRVAAAGGEYDSQFRITRPSDGQTVWLEERATALVDDAGCVTRLVGVVADVTGRKRTEEALRASEARYRALFEGLVEPAVVTDDAGRYLEINPAMSELLGYTREEMLGFRVGQVAVSRAFALAEWERFVAEGTWRGEAELRCKDGRIITVESWVRRLHLPDGPINIGTMRDVTERKRYEMAMALLAEAGAVLASSLDDETRLERIARVAVPALADSVAVYLIEGGDRSRRIALAHADPEKEILLRELERYVPGADHPNSLVGRVIRSGDPVLVPQIDLDLITSILPPEPRVHELVTALATRSVMVVPLTAYRATVGAMVFNAEAARGPYTADDLELAGELAWRIATAVDNSRLYREAREAEARVRRLFDTGVIGLLVADGERIVEANDRFLEMVGYDRDDLDAGRLRWAAMTPPEYAHLDAAAIAEIAERGFCTPFEKEYLGKDGSRVPVLIGAAAVEGTSPPWICAVLDLSTQKSAERERLAFLDALAHDVKNPLGAIKGQAQLARRRAQRGMDDPARLDDTLEGIERSVAGATALIDELLDVAHLRAGQPLELRLAEVDLVALAETCAEEARRGSPEHRIVVRSSGAAIVGRWDDQRLRRVLGNLLGNAVKYSPAGGEIVVRVGREEDAAGAWAAIAVADRGVGIPARDLPRIFDRFRRGGNVGGIAGTGIGLAGARQIVEQHGGTISVASEEGVGSTFTVRLPMA